MEVVADGLPLFNAAQLVIDTTLVSPIHRDGTPRPRTHDVNGVALQRARRNKEATYPELVGRGGGARLVVLAGVVGGEGGGFSAETAQFISSLAWVKTQGMSDLLRRRANTAWTRRWSALLSCAASRAFASSLLDGRASGGNDNETPSPPPSPPPPMCRRCQPPKRDASLVFFHCLTSLHLFSPQNKHRCLILESTQQVEHDSNMTEDD